MVKEEILEGLRYAIAKGESLPKAMMSFYNAGYSKQDIEEAARVLQSPQLPQIQQTTQPIQQPVKQRIQRPPPQQIRKTTRTPVVQRVSSYGEKQKRGKALMFVLVFFLIILFGILIAVLLFRDELAEFLGNIL